MRERHPKMKRPKKLSSSEELFALHCRAEGLPPVVREHMFATETHDRLWRFDFSWREYWVAVEIEGLVVRFKDGKPVVSGRHASSKGFREDCVKYATATIIGWNVLRFDQSLVKDGTAINLTMQLLTARGWTR
jgi:hypothetical protein